MERETRQWARVGEAVRDRMAELTMSQTDLCRASGLSDMTVRPVMNGEPVRSRPATLAKIAQALRWEPDAFDRILAGREPLPVEVDGVDPTAELVATIKTLTAAVERLTAKLEDDDPSEP